MSEQPLVILDRFVSASSVADAAAEELVVVDVATACRDEYEDFNETKSEDASE